MYDTGLCSLRAPFYISRVDIYVKVTGDSLYDHMTNMIIAVVSDFMLNVNSPCSEILQSVSTLEHDGLRNWDTFGLGGIISDTCANTKAFICSFVSICSYTCVRMYVSIHIHMCHSNFGTVIGKDRNIDINDFVHHLVK